MSVGSDRLLECIDALPIIPFPWIDPPSGRARSPLRSLSLNAITRFRLGAGLVLAGSLCVAGLVVAGHQTSATAAPIDAPVKLRTVTLDAMLKEIASKKAKLTVVDAWATWCGPCKENFPHLVEMHEKYAGKGIAFASLCLDDATKPKKVAEATEFLVSKHADFSNYLLEESQDDAFEKLDITAIPAVFLFGPDGKEIRRFTLEDVNNQFTYAEVESAVQEFLAGKPMTTGILYKKR